MVATCILGSMRDAARLPPFLAPATVLAPLVCTVASHMCRMRQPTCDRVVLAGLGERPSIGGEIRLTCQRTTYARAVKAASAVTCTEPAPGVAINGCRLLAGTSSWADRSLVRDGTFYPSRSLSAAQRLAYYASRLPLAEVATTYRFPPTPDVARRWANTTPPGFTLDVRAWSLLSGAPTWPESLWADLQDQVRPSRREGSKLYRNRLPASVVMECWERFNHAVRPLAEAGRLGAVIVRFPSWFKPRPAAWEELACLPLRLAGFRVAVELTSERWYEGDTCDQTLGLLEELGIGFVCTDSLSVKPVVAATTDIAFVRFTGAPGHASASKGLPGATQIPGPLSMASGPQTGEMAFPWARRYSEQELAEWTPAIRDLASCTSEVHIIMDNCWRSNAVDNASTLLGLLARS